MFIEETFKMSGHVINADDTQTTMTIDSTQKLMIVLTTKVQK